MTIISPFIWGPKSRLGWSIEKPTKIWILLLPKHQAAQLVEFINKATSRYLAKQAIHQLSAPDWKTGCMDAYK